MQQLTPQLILCVDDKGFVMDFARSGPELKYTLRPSEAQQFDTRWQAMCIVRANKIVDNVSIMPYN